MKNFIKLVFVSLAKAIRATRFSYLGNVNHSYKLKKNGQVSGQLTYGLYLAPHKLSGYNVCPNATKECIMGCLYASGHTAVEIFAGRNVIQNARIGKTKLFFEQQEFFMAWMIAEIKAKQAKAKRENLGFSIRLNCTSDIDWANVRVNGLNIFEIFPDVTFYDYTKNPAKFLNKPANYHLTLSYTGRNWNECLNVLSQGYNVAIVFNVKHESQIPAMYKGYEVVNGDLTDYRVDDAKGIIVGLKWKRIANKDNEAKVLNSCFVVNPETNVLVTNVQKELAVA